jgi:hypothetical protein
LFQTLALRIISETTTGYSQDRLLSTTTYYILISSYLLHRELLEEFQRLILLMKSAKRSTRHSGKNFNLTVSCFHSFLNSPWLLGLHSSDATIDNVAQTCNLLAGPYRDNHSYGGSTIFNEQNSSLTALAGEGTKVVFANMYRPSLSRQGAGSRWIFGTQMIPLTGMWPE